MVELSLKHRVDMQEMAQVASSRSGAYSPKTRLPFLITALIANFNLILVCLGAVVAAVIPYDKANGARPLERNTDDNGVLQRVRLAFFYCTIPLFLTVTSSVDALLFHRGTHRATWMLASCLIGMGLWIVQWVLEGSCIWNLSGAGGAYCPFAFSGWAGFHETGLALAWVLPWLCVPLMLVYLCYLALSVMALTARSDAAAPETSQIRRTYSYGHVHEEEGQGGRETPEPTSRAHGLRSESMFHEEEMDEKSEKEMV